VVKVAGGLSTVEVGDAYSCRQVERDKARRVHPLCHNGVKEALNNKKIWLANHMYSRLQISLVVPK
jgi:hypothetical protein